MFRWKPDKLMAAEWRRPFSGAQSHASRFKVGLCALERKTLSFRTAAGDGPLSRSTLQETLSLGVLCQIGSMKAEMMIIIMLILKDGPAVYITDF
jgi:hypothetical protein